MASLHFSVPVQRNLGTIYVSNLCPEIRAYSDPIDEIVIDKVEQDKLDKEHQIMDERMEEAWTEWMDEQDRKISTSQPEDSD